MPPSEQPVIRTIFGLPADMAHVVVSLEEAPPCLGTNFNMFRVRVTYPIFLLVQVRGLTGKMIGMLVVVRSSGRAREGRRAPLGLSGNTRCPAWRFLLTPSVGLLSACAYSSSLCAMIALNWCSSFLY